jgi:hypothetical protein
LSALTRLCLGSLRAHPRMHRLRANYRVGTNGFTSKRDVFNHFMRVCKNKGVEPKISHTFFGKIVKRYLPSRPYPFGAEQVLINNRSPGHSRTSNTTERDHAEPHNSATRFCSA